MKKVSSAGLFWVILAVGAVLVTTCYVRLQRPGGAFSGSPVSLSDADKVYIEQMTEQTKWLETLAYASLVGLIALQVKNPEAVWSRISAIGASLLIISIYAGFLSRDVILIALTKGTQLLYSTLGTMPYTTQVWCLVVALALLAKDILWKKRIAAVASSALLLLTVLWLPSAMGQVTNAAQKVTEPAQKLKDSVPDCVTNWAKSRFTTKVTPDEQILIANFLAKTAERSHVPTVQAQSCAFMLSTMDRVRNASSAIAGDDDYSDTLDLVRSLNSQLDSNGAAPGTFLATLIEDLQIWRGPVTGSISIETKRSGVGVMVNGKYIGPGPLLYIAAPGTYTVEATSGGLTIFKSTLSVVANVQSVAVIP